MHISPRWLCNSAWHWFVINTFAPRWLHSRWSHPALGYAVAVLLQAVTVFAVSALIHVYPTFLFLADLVILVVMLIALGWGAGPSIFATIVGAILLIFLIFPPYFSLAIERTEDVLGVCFYVIVGLIVSVFASQAQRARHHAEELSTRLEAIIEAIPDSLAIYDQQGKAMVIERERLLTERAEAHANELALRETTRLMDEFIGIAGHELRTPLTTIKGNMQLAKRQLSRATKLPQARQGEMMNMLLSMDNLLDRAERQVRRQNRLVSDLVDVSRIHAGQMELRPEWCDVSALVREVVEEQVSLTPARTIDLEFPFQGKVPVMADPDRLRQVVSNYLSNALKYSEADKKVLVSVEQINTQVRVSVRDEGPGLTPAQQQRIWERFYRAPGIEVKSGSGVGLGLGLNISQMIIEQLGGQVGIQSEPGKGSTFWFTLPVAEQEKE